MSDGIEVTLTDLEVRLSRQIGKLRFQKARSLGIPDEKIGNQSNAETDIESAGAEVAFCKQYNIYPDLQFEVRPIEDAIFPNGMTVDVKQTHLTNGRLLVRRTKVDKRCDAYVLVTGVLPTFTIRGGYPGDLLFDDQNLKDIGYGLNYVIEQKELKKWPVSSLLWRYEYGCVTQEVLI